MNRPIEQSKGFGYLELGLGKGGPRCSNGLDLANRQNIGLGVRQDVPVFNPDDEWHRK